MKAIKETNIQDLTPEEMMAQIGNGTLAQPTSNEAVLDKTLLPSRGKFYGDDKITVTKMSGLDIKTLSKMTVNNANPIINNILSKCVKGVPLNNILLNDKLWLMYYLRSFTYNDRPIDVIAECPICGKTHKVQYRLNDLDVVYYDKELPEEPVRMPNGDLVSFEFPTIGIEIQTNRYKHDPNILNHDEIDDEYMLISSYLKEVNGKKVTLLEAYEYMTQRASADDFSFVVNTMNDYVFGAKPTASYECTCGGTAKAQIDFDSKFFMPKREV